MKVGNNYQEVFELQEEVFKTIANQKRLEIIHLLTHGSLRVNDIAEMLGIRQSNVSQHLAVLKQTGIVISTRNGHEITYELADPKIAEATEIIREFLRQKVGGEIEAQIKDNPNQNLYPIIEDHVCKMRLPLSSATGPEVLDNKEYYFCALGCRNKFIKNPEKYN